MKNYVVSVICLVHLISPVALANPADFTVPAVLGDSKFSLKAARGKYVALHFLLKTECPFCMKHTQDYVSKADKLPGVIQVFLKPDSEAELKAWAEKLPAGTKASLNLYRDANATLATDFGIEKGYFFHGGTVHFPATILLGPDGKEVFRYVGKNNSDRLDFEALAAKTKELPPAK